MIPAFPKPKDVRKVKPAVKVMQVRSVLRVASAGIAGLILGWLILGWLFGA